MDVISMAAQETLKLGRVNKLQQIPSAAPCLDYHIRSPELFRKVTRCQYLVGKQRFASFSFFNRNQ